MTDYHWHETREHAIQVFGGETPGAELEQYVINEFLHRPAAVIRAVDHVAQRYAAGKITSSCWGVLRAHLREHATSDVVANDSSERTKAIKRAENWLRTCGPHYDRQTEVLDELFGDRGLLQPWHNDQPLRQRMLDHWAEQRRRGEQHEADEHERSERFVEQRRCPNCGTITPFAMRPCTTLQCRRRAIAAALVAEAEHATTTTPAVPDQEPALDAEPILDPDAEPALA